MSIGQIFHRMDALLLDDVFEPIVYRLRDWTQPFALGSSFLLGSVVLQAATTLLPMLGGANFADNIQGVLAFLCGLVIYFSFQRFAPLVRPGQPNPLRPMLFSLRVVVLLYVIGCSVVLWWRPPPRSVLLWEELDILSQLVFVIGLYFMSCQPPPPARQSQREERRQTLQAMPEQS
ncbi:hypothetical protein [Oecophyllibacter saccharovorans]|uniref:Uncharacterized protein n=1 Tax=Oecophyllibacter saccharovorans TaxID=2558360 RepID=A0A506ULX3_9PROT|nr:hypothetical protein [Oecophyllibacter saccharovorans]QDH15350.1 hypothetical protein E3E11_05240 [Oecophyllibacter saccharovorans]TPW34183.1 hypothetical protein E3202_06595 [Oecophyllibacter saccharovorans]TPW36368.1 hypothetical protein E3203_00825 [Oecophyllibacter saccharovorans]